MRCLARKRFLGIPYGRYCAQEDSLHMYRRSNGGPTPHMYVLTPRVMLGEEAYRRLVAIWIIKVAAWAVLGAVLGRVLRVTFGW